MTRILITGGTGSFGKTFIANAREYFPDLERLVIFSRDELKQFEMQQQYPPEEYPQLRFFIGDVRDKQRIKYALEDIDIVVHAAALKQVPTAEYNPFEAIKTNILGAQNLIEACLEMNVRRVVALSTDKAAAPINLYGATKLASDKLFIAANNFKGKRDLRFAVVRYGNVMGSRGSVMPFFLEQRHKGIIPITDQRMTRFNITLQEGVDMVVFAIRNMLGGELFVPKIPSYRITDVAEAIAPSVPQKIVGIRPGEKLHEEMITQTDALATLEFAKHYIILPSTYTKLDIDRFRQVQGGELCPEGFRYSSDQNKEWLSVEQIRQLIREHLDPNFTPL